MKMGISLSNLSSPTPPPVIPDIFNRESRVFSLAVVAARSYRAFFPFSKAPLTLAEWERE